MRNFFNVEASEEDVEIDSSNALVALEQADALFEVEYKAATFEKDGHIHRPVYEKGKNEGKPLYHWVVRGDTGEALGLHSGKYAKLPSYRFLGETAETVFPNSTSEVRVWDRGERVALIQEISEPVDLGGGDTIQPHVIWVSSFNGQWATAVHSLTNRLWCLNQLVSVPLLKVRHTINHNELFKFRVQVVEAARERAAIQATMARTLKDQNFTDVEFLALVRDIVPLPPKPLEGEIHAKAQNLVDKKRKGMITRWEAECEHWGVKNKWLAYNAVQGTEQHLLHGRGKSQEEKELASLTKAIDDKTPLAKRALVVLNA